MENETRMYRTQPVHILPQLRLQVGYAELAQRLREYIVEAQAPALIVIDGFVGVQWLVFARHLHTVQQQQAIGADCLSTMICFRPAEQIEQRLASTLTGDPVFGRVFQGHLEELWEEWRSAALGQQMRERTGTTILYGLGASLITLESGLHVYVDVPKDRGQELGARKLVYNVGASELGSDGETYKRFYFVDWPMLNRVKRAIWRALISLLIPPTRIGWCWWVATSSGRRCTSWLGDHFASNPGLRPDPGGAVDEGAVWSAS